MKRIFYLTVASAFILTSCKDSFKKTTGGILYKIVSDEKEKVMENGNFFEIQFDQTYKDSNIDTVLADSRNFGNQIAQLDSQIIPPVYYNIFKKLRKGDSLIIKQPTDSIIKMGNTPPFIKKGQYIVAHYKIINVFQTKEQADNEYKIQMQLAKQRDSIKAIGQLAKDDKVITEYLTKNKITAVKAPQGTYVEILTPGTGDAVDTGKVMKVNYTGRTLEGGKVFDSNTDPKFGHPQVFAVNLNVPAGAPGSVIKGWTDGLSLLKKGSKARLYIPSSLGYGARGAGNDIKPNQNLIFDVEVVDVVTAAQAKAEEEVERKKIEDMQKHALDSAQKANKK